MLTVMTANAEAFVLYTVLVNVIVRCRSGMPVWRQRCPWLAPSVLCRKAYVAHVRLERVWQPI